MTSDRARVQKLLPRYEVGEEIGRGGFGIVWAAVHRDLQRPEAVKMLLPKFAEDPRVRARFVAEAQVVAAMNHPHIVPIYDFLERDGICLLIMERLGGGSVSSRLRQGTVTRQWACAVALASCAGLHHAHTRGVLHRDVKPENLLFSDDGTLKVTDFGIAKVLAANETRITEAGSILGSPAYMAPEQAEGREVGAQADVYALGVVLYELLSGQLPFSEEGHALAVLVRRLTDDPRPLLELVPDISPALNAVVMRALERSAADRFPTAEAFGVELDLAATASWGPGWLEKAGLPLVGGGRIGQSIRPDPEASPLSRAPAERGLAPKVVHPPDPAERPMSRRKRWIPVGVGLGLVAALVTVVTLRAKAPSSAPPGSTGSVTSISREVASSDSPVTNPSPRLFQDGFSALGDWPRGDTETGLQGYVNGKYSILGKKDDNSIVSSAPMPAPPERVRVEVDADPVTLSDVRFGIVCRRGDESGPNYYAATIGRNGAWSIVRNQTARGQAPQRTRLLEGRNSTTIRPVDVNRLAFECSGAGAGQPVRLRLEVNGQELGEIEDSQGLASGPVGLLVLPGPTVPAEVRFDNFVVSAL